MSPVEIEDQPTSKSSTFASLLILVGFVLLGLFVGQLVGFMVSLLLVNFDMQRVTEMMMNPTSDPQAKILLLIMQAGGTLFGFILAPLLHLRLIDQKHKSILFHTQHLDITLLAVTFLIMMAFMIANSIVIDWNMNIDFGQFSTSFEEWARAKEEELSELTKYLTRFDSAGGLFAGLIVIAVLPAIGEEVVFRGVLQRKMYHIAGNPHVAIWVAAILFSTIHFQFYGFFPRMLLGALFGYIYYWSGNLWYPIFAHFVNNGFTLIMLYLYQQKATDIDLEATDAVPWGAALIALVVGTALLVYFKGTVFKIRRSYHGQ